MTMHKITHKNSLNDKLKTMSVKFAVNDPAVEKLVQKLFYEKELKILDQLSGEILLLDNNSALQPNG